MSGLYFTNESEWFAAQLRRVYEPFFEGVLDTDMAYLEVSEGLTGLSIDVAPGSAIVQGDSTPDQGKYLVEQTEAINSDDFVDGGLEPADPDDPRIDQIVAHVYDEDYGDPQSEFRLEVLIGTPTTGATLVNHNGAAALPDSAFRLAYVLVSDGATEITAPDIEDTRTSAR